MQSKRIVFTIGDIKIKAIARDTPTAKAILESLPIQSAAQTWGKEIYFSVPVTSDLEHDARNIVKAGEIAFWVEGCCIAIGFGPTPISLDNEIKLAAAANIWADAEDDVRQLISAHSQDTVRVNWSG